MGHFDELSAKNVIAASAEVAGRGSERLVPSLDGLAAATVNTAGTLTAVANQISVNNFTGAAAQVVTLPAASIGDVVVFALSVDTTGGTDKLSFDCAGTDAYKTGSVIESRATNVLTYDTSTAGETLIEFTPANAVTNYISQGSKFIFWCSEAGLWNVHLEAKPNPASTGITGATAFAA